MNKINRFVFVREMISFHPEDVTVITSAFHIQWMFLKRITRVTLEYRYETTKCTQTLDK
jgi:hypothetical protein